MRNKWAVPFLTLFLLGSILWGVGQNKARQQLETRMDLGYQQAFYALNWHLENLENETAKVLAANSKEQISRSSRIIWREANSASDSLGRLPLRVGAMAKTGNFLTQLSTFSNFTSDQKINTGKLTEAQWQTMRKIHNKVKAVNTELKVMESQLADNSTNWRDLERATASSSNKIPENVLYKSFDGIEKQMDNNSIIDFAEQFPDPMVIPKGITGPNITRALALAIAKSFVSPRQLSNKVFRSTGQGTGTIATYGVEAVSKNVRARERIQFDITKRGGHVLWMISERPIGNRTISVETAKSKARQFLVNKGYPSMALTTTTPYDGITILSFVYNQNNVLVYPDMIKLAVAQDTGEITQFNASNYLVFHHNRVIPKPALSFSQARAKLNKHITVEQEKIALILNEQRKEVLCYEFRGKIGSDVMVVFINAMTGEEEVIQRVTASSNNKLQAGAPTGPIFW